MTDPPDRRPTNPKARAQLAPIATTTASEDTRPALDEAEAIAHATEDDVITLCRCPLCQGGGLVSPEIASTFESMIADAKERT